MSPKLTVLFFAAFLFVARAVPVAEDFDDDDDDDVIEEGERAEPNVDFSDLTQEDLREIVEHVQNDLKRAVGKLLMKSARSIFKMFLSICVCLTVSWNVCLCICLL